MRRLNQVLVVVLGGTALAACGGTPAGSSSGATSAASPSATAVVSETPAPTAKATTLEPCQVVTAAEASQIAGTTYGPGRDEPDSGNGKLCVYGYQTRNVFMVTVAVAPSATEANAEWETQVAKAEAYIKSAAASNVPGLTVDVTASQVGGIGDHAAYITGSATYQGYTFHIGGFYLLKGATFVGFNDLNLGGAAPTSTALEAEAQTVVGRLP